MESEELRKQMDLAAATAVEELHSKAMKDPNVKAAIVVVARWLKNYYQLAGYKRLSRALLAMLAEFN
jgi:hypothetical protein